VNTVLMAAYTNYRRDPRVRREAEALAAAGYRVIFLSSRQRGEPNTEVIAGVEVRKLWGIGNRRTSASGYIVDYAVFFLLTMVHLLRHPLRYDLIHTNNMPDFLAFAGWLPRLLGRPLIHDVHDLMPELYREKFGARDNEHWLVRLLLLQERWAGRFATAVLTVEDRLKDILSARGIPREKISVLMNLPDDRIFAPVAERRARPIGAPVILVYHGTLARRLGLDIAIRALALVKEHGSCGPIEFRIIGAGEERDRLIELRDRLGLGGEITFSDGFVPVERIPELIEDADIGLVPLRASAGTDIMLPTKLLEYVCMGIACIAPKTGTICRYFDEEMLQFFEAEDVQSLAQAIVALCTDPARRQRLAARATEKFAERYRWSEHQRIYTDLVTALLQGPRHRKNTTPGDVDS